MDGDKILCYMPCPKNTGPPAKNEWEIELQQVKNKYENLQREWDKQQEHLGRLQGTVYKLRNQLQTQSAFCASLGSIMGNLVWKASRLQPVIELLMTTSKLSDFFCLASGTLVSYLETYAKEVPDVKSDETQFIISMGGIVANVAAIPEGRQFLVTDESGKELIEQIIRLLPNIPSGSGDPLKRILLMVLYNVSINQTGLMLIQDQKPLLVTISQLLVGEKPPELRLMALRLLESVTFEIPNRQVLNLILQYVSPQKLNQLCQVCDIEMRQYASNVLVNIEKAEGLFSQSTLIAPPRVPFNECSLIKESKN